MRRTMLALPFLAFPAFAPEAAALTRGLTADRPIRPESVDCGIDGGAIDRIRCSLVQSVYAALMPGATYGTHF